MGEYPFFWADFLKKWWNFAVSLRCKCNVGMALPRLRTRREFSYQSWHLLFSASFSNNNGIVAHLRLCRCLFNPYLEWVEEEELFIGGFFSTCCHLKKVRGRDGWEMGTVVYFWLHDPCLCLPPGPLYGLHTKRKTSHNGSTQAAYKAGQVINGVRGPVGNELGTSFSRMMQNNTREGCSQMQDNHCYEWPTA